MSQNIDRTAPLARVLHSLTKGSIVPAISKLMGLDTFVVLPHSTPIRYKHCESVS